MKKLIALLIALAFVIGIPGSVIAEKDVDKQVDQQNASQYCTANDNMGYNNLGRCVRVYMACNGPGIMEAACICRIYQDEDPTGFFTEYNNQEECISYHRDGYVHE